MDDQGAGAVTGLLLERLSPLKNYQKKKFLGETT
jgi:hypothetical protein